MTESTQPGPGYVLAGRYLLEERLGRGGMSTVWRARDQVLGREVAVKVVAEMEDAEVTAERFRRETRVTAALNHPNIVTVFDAGVDNDRAFLVMELLPGSTLADELRTRGAFPFEEIRSIAIQVSAALGAAHHAGLVHRDVKPGNIARAADGAVKVLDFGITHIIDEAVADSGSPLTATGAVIGTAAYLAPEQARGMRVDQRADIYALGCVLFALITGRPPFQGPTAVSTMMAHATEPVPNIQEARPDVPPQLAAIVAAMLAKDPEARPTDAATLEAALRAETSEAVTQLLPPPVVEGEHTAVVPAADLPAPMRAYPADAPGPVVAAPVVAPARAAVDPEGTDDDVLPMEEEEESSRRGLLIGLITLAVLLVVGFAWWLLSGDPQLTADRSPTAAVPASTSPSVDASPSVSPSPQTTEASPSPTPSPSPSPSAAPATTTAAPATTAPVTTEAPPPQTEPPVETAPPVTQAPPPADPGNIEGAAQSAQAAADELSTAVREAFTGGNLDNDARKAVDAGLRDLSSALRSGDEQLASDAISAVDQALSDSGQKDQFEGLYERLKDQVDSWNDFL
ncbi:serine/threonine protein kinase [Tessaracoccus sp. MC1865]|uniref:serine/threonine-protein kinase n=1 Tax=Tessaracoccus sp. MC1865 TaxID=2760310 RepID=UPI0016036AF5|nr:serine/threonine-protein kinase [Tessaracoccus sp. MC1865]MBB1483248.1 serine/threonine protein kinase [Tessaracoccus sp. MC1865]QTO37340.1 serine/threonine protein kinase [Tessaracoccus sp. MC1865]